MSAIGIPLHAPRLPALKDALIRARPAVTAAAVLIFAGIELAVLLAWLPDTARQWWHAGQLAPNDERPMGDWQVFYRYAQDLDANGLYSPILPVLQHPFTWLEISAAYRLYTVIGALCVLAIAWMAQRTVSSAPAKIAIVLGVLSLPQMHWAIRGATLTPFLALATLAGFVLIDRMPRLAGAMLATLTLKPQFAVVPAAYLLCSRRWIALRTMVAVAAIAAFAGLVIVGMGYAGTYAGMLFDWGPDQRDNLSPIAQSWQHTWPGVLRSLGMEPNPLLWLDLIAVSLIAIYFACRRASPGVQFAAVTCGMLLATPYAMFYDWGLLTVAGVLLLRQRDEHPILIPTLLVGGYVAAVLTQAATPYPPPFPTVDGGTIVWPSGTFGPYLAAPFLLVALAALAAAAHRTGTSPVAERSTL